MMMDIDHMKDLSTMAHEHIPAMSQHGTNDGESAVICRTAEQSNASPPIIDDRHIAEEQDGEDVEIVCQTSTAHAFNDGGRAAAGYKGPTGDCVCRAIAIATRLPYQEVYNALNESASAERITKRRRKKSNARTGVHKDTSRKYLKRLGWLWVPTMFIGRGCTVHLRADELPAGRLIAQVSHHFVAVIDGVIQDTYDCAREGTRCVYGYYMKPDGTEDHDHE
jgi:hypothetical protein